jgi:hypothetical protein
LSHPSTSWRQSHPSPHPNCLQRARGQLGMA